MIRYVKRDRKSTQWKVARLTCVLDLPGRQRAHRANLARQRAAVDADRAVDGVNDHRGDAEVEGPLGVRKAKVEADDE